MSTITIKDRLQGIFKTVDEQACVVAGVFKCHMYRVSTAPQGKNSPKDTAYVVTLIKQDFYQQKPVMIAGALVKQGKHARALLTRVVSESASVKVPFDIFCHAETELKKAFEDAQNKHGA